MKTNQHLANECGRFRDGRGQDHLIGLTMPHLQKRKVKKPWKIGRDTIKQNNYADKKKENTDQNKVIASSPFLLLLLYSHTRRFIIFLRIRQYKTKQTQENIYGFFCLCTRPLATVWLFLLLMQQLLKKWLQLFDL